MPESSEKELLKAWSELSRGFYEAAILESSLTASLRAKKIAFQSPGPNDNDPLLTAEQRFQCFVRKLAQVCDSRRGGSTVTSFVVLKGLEGPQYLFASNQRDEVELAQVASFITDLLELVNSYPVNLKHKPLIKQVLWKILLFNLPRVGAYIKKLSEALEDCLEDERRNPRQEGRFLTQACDRMYMTHD